VPIVRPWPRQARDSPRRSPSEVQQHSRGERTLEPHHALPALPSPRGRRVPSFGDPLVTETLPYMPLFPKDVLAQAVNLDALERGALWSLMFACWMEGGWLDADPRRLARTAAVETRRWDDVWAAIERFFERDGGRVHNPAVTAALAEAMSKSASRKAIARLGGAAKAAKARRADSTADRTAVSRLSVDGEQEYGTTVSVPTVCYPSPSSAPLEEDPPPRAGARAIPQSRVRPPCARWSRATARWRPSTGRSTPRG
jgi:uncharacterized protein YdaU (DUF1376 family)